MADSLTKGLYSLAWETGTISDDSDRLNQVADDIILGGSKFPEIGAELTNGTGASQANKHWGKKLTLTAALTTTLNLFDGSLTNGRGQSVAFTNIRRILIRLRTPVAGALVRVGGAATPWAPWLSVVTATEDIASVRFCENDIDGWTVSNTAKLLALNNPGATTINVDVVLVGK